MHRTELRLNRPKYSFIKWLIIVPMHAMTTWSQSLSVWIEIYNLDLQTTCVLALQTDGLMIYSRERKLCNSLSYYVFLIDSELL